MSKYVFDHIFKKEENASKHINILTHYADDTLIDKSGKLIKIFKLSGLNSATLDKKLLDIYKTRRNHLFKSFSSDIAFYFWQRRRQINTFPQGEFVEPFSQEVNQKYENKIINSSMFHTEHYLAVIAKQPEGLVNKCYSFFSLMKYKFDHEAKKAHFKKFYQLLNDAALRIKNSFSDYQCELLSIDEKNDIAFSSPLSFVSDLINIEPSSIPLSIENAAHFLPKKRLFFNRRSGTIEIRNAQGESKFAAILSIKTYTPNTYQGILNELNHLPFEYIITQSYRPYDRQVAKGRLRDQQKEMLQSEEESKSLTEEIDEFYDETASGELGYGKHHYTLACYANSIEALNHQVGVIVSLFSDVDITCVREDVGCELGFWAQLPGNFGYICRPADISTKNIASFASFYNYPMGKLTNNWWGNAVTVFETLSGSPYYFNFHYRDVGNFLIFGAMGSGKTVLVGFLILQSMKFGGKRIIFDKDRGLEIMVRALDGIYERIKPGIRTGFNPCHLEDTVENRAFLLALFKKMLIVSGEILTESDIEIIESAIHGLYSLDRQYRQLCHLASFFGAKKPGSLRARFDEWHGDGQYAWLFDNEKDSLNLNATIIGFDLGQLLNEQECKTPALMYLLYRVEQALARERGMLFCDEGWHYLNDEYFSQSINDWSRTPRKKNNIFGLATQVANDTVHSAISKSINESAFCKIFFPNPSADKKVHVNEFGLSEAEYELIKTLADDQHYFLLVYGRSLNKESVVLKANLAGLEDEIAIISAREETLILMDLIISEVGSDPKKWLPLFHERRKRI